ncbi:MAG TPA: hypothetical protein VKT31_00020 [Solirubrobacteraceae bacterium]|nr:hypothetical protein [Solirubrobacteraceae bacterium]
MSATRAVMIVALTAVALALSACGAINVKPRNPTASRGVVDDQRTILGDHVACLQADKIPVQLVGNTDMLIAGQVRVHFDPSPGAAIYDQIQDHAQGAEVIGSALLYPGDAPDSELNAIEACMAVGIKG